MCIQQQIKKTNRLKIYRIKWIPVEKIKKPKKTKKSKKPKNQKNQKIKKIKKNYWPIVSRSERHWSRTQGFSTACDKY